MHLTTSATCCRILTSLLCCCVCCCVLQCVAVCRAFRVKYVEYSTACSKSNVGCRAIHSECYRGCTTAPLRPQHTAAHCSTLQHTATHCNIMGAAQQLLWWITRTCQQQLWRLNACYTRRTCYIACTTMSSKCNVGCTRMNSKCK